METAIRLGQGKRGIEDAVAYAVTHQTRIEIRAILHEGPRSHDELARLIDRPGSKRVGHHLKELLADGSIEIAYVKKVRNALQHYYRAVEVPFYSDEEVAAMPPEARQAITGVILQAIMAEAMAALWAGKMMDDRRAWLSWRWFNVDQQGRGDVADEQARSWARMQEIEAEAAGRVAKSGEPTKSIIVSSLGYVRSRSAPRMPVITETTEQPAAPLRLGQGKRDVAEAVSFAFKYKCRVEILTLLNAGEYNRYELADSIGEAPDKIKHHLKELLDEGSIELAHSRRVGNLIQHYYRAVKMPFYGDDEFVAMPRKARQAIAGVIVQAIMAEALTAFAAGTMMDDRRLWLSWRWFNVDAQGREDIADEQARSWARMHEIEAEAAERVAKSGEPTKSIMVSSLGYVRSRRAAKSGPGKSTSEPVVGGRQGSAHS